MTFSVKLAEMFWKGFQARCGKVPGKVAERYYGAARSSKVRKGSQEVQSCGKVIIKGNNERSKIFFVLFVSIFCEDEDREMMKIGLIKFT